MKIALIQKTLFLLLLSSSLYAVDLPRSTDPGRVNQELTRPELTPGLSKDVKFEEKPNQQESATDKTTFVLTKVIIDDETVFTEAELEPLYQQYIGKPVSLANLQAIAQLITNAYQKAGYALSTAIIPGQRISDGTVHIQVVEGFVDALSKTRLFAIYAQPIPQVYHYLG